MSMRSRRCLVFTGKPFFVQLDEPSAADYIYFGYTTLTTVGYGDLTAAESPGAFSPSPRRSWDSCTWSRPSRCSWAASATACVKDGDR